MKIENRLTVRELARRSGVAVSALHYYEARGLIRSTRSSGNQRRYARQVLRRLAVIKAAQRVGVPLAAIHEALKALPSDRAPTAAEWRRLSSSWRAELDERIARLTQLCDRLDECIGGCLSARELLAAQPWDRLGAKGPGRGYSKLRVDPDPAANIIFRSRPTVTIAFPDPETSKWFSSRSGVVLTSLTKTPSHRVDDIDPPRASRPGRPVPYARDPGSRRAGARPYRR